MSTGRSASGPEVRAAGAMMQSMGSLETAAAAFAEAGDQERARAAESLMRDVEALDPNLHRRLYAALPGPGEVAERAETIAERAGVDLSVACRALELMRYPFGRATQGGGWWRRA